MKIAFFTIVPTTGMYASLVQEFIKHGHKITVIAPTYQGSSRIEYSNNVEIVYFRSLQLFNVGIVRKGLAHLMMPILANIAVKRLLHKRVFDMAILTTPPISLYKPIRYIKRINHKCFFYLVLRDIHPEGAKFIGLDKIAPLYAYFRGIEKRLYNLSDAIGCMSPAGIDFIAKRNTNFISQKLQLLPNWGDRVEYTTPNISVRVKYGLVDKFIFVYGGNIGIPQNLELILQLAKARQHIKDMIFLFIGGGTEKVRLETLAQEMHLNNVRFIDKLPQQDYNEVIKSCDVGIISLHPNSTIPNIPSKVIGYLSAKLPIFAAIDSITDFGQFIVDQAECGYWAIATDTQKLLNNIDELYKDSEKAKQMGENGYRYYIDHYTTDITYNTILSAYNGK